MFRIKMIILASLGMILVPLEAILGHLGMILVHLGTLLEPLGALLGRSWSSQGATGHIDPSAVRPFGDPPPLPQSY